MMATAIFSYNNVQTDQPARQPKPHTEGKKKTDRKNKPTIRELFSFSQTSFLPLLHRSHKGARKKEIIRRKEKEKKRNKRGKRESYFI